MRQITREEAAFIRDVAPNTFILVTSRKKGKSAKRYAIEETRSNERLLQCYRNTLEIAEHS